MKINELKQPHLNEGFLDALIGDGRAAGIKSIFNPGMTAKTQEAKDIFNKDFVADAIASLQNAVKSGLVVPKASGATPNATPNAAPKVDPNAVKFTAQPTANTPANPTGKNVAATDPYENLKGKMRQLQPKPGSKPLPDKFAAELNSDMAKLAKGDKESGTYAANKILKFANAGYDVSKLSPTWTASSKAGERFLTQSIYRAITNMLREHSLTWDNLGLRTRLYESVGETGVFLSRCKPIPVSTLEFKKMDQVFEGIVTELFGKQPVEGAESISSYMMDWFSQWMTGVDWNKRKPQVQSLINAIEASYPRGNWKGAIQQLAKAAYAITTAGSSVPKGVQNAETPATTTANPAASKVDVWSNPDDAEEQLKIILKNNPNLAKKYNIKP